MQRPMARTSMSDAMNVLSESRGEQTTAPAQIEAGVDDDRTPGLSMKRGDQAMVERVAPGGDRSARARNPRVTAGSSTASPSACRCLHARRSAPRRGAALGHGQDQRYGGLSRANRVSMLLRRRAPRGRPARTAGSLRGTSPSCSARSAFRAARILEAGWCARPAPAARIHAALETSRPPPSASAAAI